MIEELKKQKELNLQRIGTAHLEAEAAKKRTELEYIERQEKQIRDVQNRKARGSEAIMKERQLQKQRREIEEEILCLERKKVVQ